MSFNLDRFIDDQDQQQAVRELLGKSSSRRSRNEVDSNNGWNQLLTQLRTQSGSGGKLPFGEDIVAALHKFPEYRGQVFTGFNPETGHPRLTARSVFNDHAYVLGATGSGKTSCAVIPLAEQLALHVDANGQSLGELPPHPIVIIDLKERLDADLLGAANRIAQSRGQGDTCLFFTGDDSFKGLRWNPLSAARLLYGVNKQAGFIMNSLGLVYEPRYGAEYFSGAMRIALHAVLSKEGLEAITFDRLTELVKELIASKKERKANFEKDTEAVATNWKDARALYDKLQSLPHLRCLATGIYEDGPDILKLDEVIANGRVLYIHLGSTFQAQESWDIARLFIFSLVHFSAEEQYKDRFAFGEQRRCFVFADEFQRIGPKNIVQRLEDARSIGMSFILSHQTRASLSAEPDLFELVFENTAFRQIFSCENLELLELLQRLSGTKSQLLRSESTSVGRQAGVTNTGTHTDAQSHGVNVNAFGLIGETWTQGASDSRANARSRQSSLGKVFGFSEKKVPRYDDDANQTLNASHLSSVIYARDAGRGSVTPTNAEPTLTRNHFYRERERRSYQELGYIKKTSEEIADEIAGPKQVQPVAVKVLAAPPSKPTQKQHVKKNDPMKLLIRDAASSLGTEIPESRVASTVARNHGVPLAKIESLCSEHGFRFVADGNSVIPCSVLLKVKKQLLEQGTKKAP